MLDITIPTSITVSTIPQEVVILVDDGDLPMADRIKKPGMMTSSWSVLPFVLALGLVLGLAFLRLFAFGGLALCSLLSYRQEVVRVLEDVENQMRLHRMLPFPEESLLLVVRQQWGRM